MTRRPLRARVAAAGLMLLAGWEIAALVGARASAPTDADWRAVAAAVRQSAGQDSLIVFAPSWIDPVGRQWLGDRISVDEASRMDAARYADVWEVSIRGATAPEVSGRTAQSDRTFGAIRVRHFVRPAPHVTWDLRSHSHVHEVDFEPRKGLLFELRNVYQQRRQSFRGVMLGTELHVYAGLADYKTRYFNRATALLQVMVDGQEVARGLIGNDSGWQALPVAATVPGRHDVEFVARVHDPRPPIVLALSVAAESRLPQ